MTIFNAYEKSDEIYIRLNDDLLLYVGEYNPFVFTDQESLDIKERFTPAGKSTSKDLHVVKSDKFFTRKEKFDGIEIDIDSRYYKSIIKKTLGEPL